MKSFIILGLLLAAPVFGATNFVNGQAARAVIGQYAFSYNYDTPSGQILGAPAGLAWVNGTLFVADSNVIGDTPIANRVMMFDTTQIPGLRDDLSTVSHFDQFCHVCGYPAYNVLGQTNYTNTNPGITATAMQEPTGVATDGTRLAVADTSNNRVLIWNSIPTQIDQAADLVLGQSNFTSNSVNEVSASALRGPEGVWIQNNMLFVADTLNHRVLIWTSFPTSNNQPANIVLGQSDLTSANEPPVTTNYPTVTASDILNPTSVTADSGHLYVSDLGSNRVMIWNGIPSSNNQPADVVVGQLYMTTSIPNNEVDVCGVSSTDTNGNPLPCDASLNFPRYALSDGNGRLFIADGGNDRILIYNSIPASNGAHANIVLGQPDFTSDIVTDTAASIISTTVDNTASTDSIPAPMALAWDGTNLYASDPTNERVLIYTPADVQLAQKSVLNTASKITRQTGSVTLAGSIVAKDTVSITVGSSTYTYTIKSSDTLTTVASGLVSVINSANSGAGDSNATALVSDIIPDTVLLDSKSTNPGLNSIALSATTSNSTDITATASGEYLTGGNAGLAAPGTLIEIDETDGGGHLSDSNLMAGADATLPLDLAGVQVFMDGIQVPIVMVSPNQIISQVPFAFTDRTSSSLFVRTVHNDGSVTVTTATPVTIPGANPGLFAGTGSEPRSAVNIAMHQSGNPSATVSVDGSVQAGDQGTITINGRGYSYTVQSSDSLASVVTAFVNKINNAPDPQVKASAGGAFTRVVLTARQAGGAGSGIPVTTSVTAASGKTSADLTLTAYQSSTCCATSGSGAVTASNPALPNETITFPATGLGTLEDLNGNLIGDAIAGLPYTGTVPNTPVNSVNATVGTSTGQVVGAGVETGSIGVYSVDIIMPSSLTASSFTQVNIAQNAFISNSVTIPTATSAPSLIASPNPMPVSSSGALGSTTLSWNVSNSYVQLRVGSATGALVSAGEGTGSATTGDWVANGTTFYLVDASTKATITTLTVSTTVVASSNAIVFTANPNPIEVPSGTTHGVTTLGWYSPSSTSGASVHLGSASGPLFASSVGVFGSATTGDWVSNGSTFYLVDNSSGATLAKLVVGLSAETTTTAGEGGIDPNIASIALIPNPVLAGPSGHGSAAVSWAAPNTSGGVAIHVGSPSGPLFAEGASTGYAETGEWITDGMVFYLVDMSNGQSLGSVTAAVSQQQASISASPNPISGSGVHGQTTINWNCPYCTMAQVRVGSADGPLFAASVSGSSGSAGSATTGDWVTNGMTFYLQDGTSGDITSSANTVGTVTVQLSK